MARRRGFFAELQHLNQQAAKRRRQEEVAAYSARVAAQREAERARQVAERARVAAVAASARERVRLEMEAARLHLESRAAEVDSLNAGLAQSREEIDGILAAALTVDDYVDLEALRVTKVDHPPFEPGPLGVPTRPVAEPVYLPEPGWREPPPPGGVFGGKKKHAELIAQARAEFERTHRAWWDRNAAIYTAHEAALRQRAEAERQRMAQLLAAEARYRSECQGA